MFETHTFDEAESDDEGELHRQTEIYYTSQITKKSHNKNRKSNNSLKSLTLPREKLSKKIAVSRTPPNHVSCSTLHSNLLKQAEKDY